MTAKAASSWKVARGQRFSLRPHVDVYRHVYRDAVWYVLHDRVSDRFHRIPEEGARFIAGMDGRRTMADHIDARFIDPVLPDDNLEDEDRLSGFLLQLQSLNLLRSDYQPPLPAVEKKRARMTRAKLLGQIRTPLAFRIPLFDPTRILDILQPWTGFLFGPVGLFLWLFTVSCGIAGAIFWWDPLTDNALDQMLSLQNLALIWLIYPVVKIIHEFSHALAIRHRGGEVHEIGVMLLALFPVPYVNATAATAFTDRRDRMLVGAAGIMAEVTMASIAVLIWGNAEPGTLRAVLHNVMLICGISTVLFNGNPLQRFDAYYVFADMIEIPNLAPRSSAYVGWLIKYYLLGLRHLPQPSATPGERRWFIFYAPASLVYRTVLIVTILLYVAETYLAVGVAMAVWSITGLVVPFVTKVVSTIRKESAVDVPKIPLILKTLFWLIGFPVLLLLTPLPLGTVAQGVIWTPEEAQVYARVPGFVEQVLAADGQRVAPGTPLLRLSNPDIDTRVVRLRARVRELEAEVDSERPVNLVRAAIAEERLLRARADLARALEEQNNLLVTAELPGRLVLEDDRDMKGRFLGRGVQAALVAPEESRRVRVVVEMGDIDLVRRKTLGVEVRLFENTGEVIPAEVLREVPAATEFLPSPVLSVEGGGPYAVQPDQQGRLRLPEPLFQFDILLPEGHGTPLVGGRAAVRFEHGLEPVVFRLWRLVRRTFLSKFDV